MDILNHHLTIGTNTGKISPRAKAHITRGDVAQLGEHHVRNVGVVGSNPIISTTETKSDRKLSLSVRFAYEGPASASCFTYWCKRVDEPRVILQRVKPAAFSRASLCFYTGYPLG